MRALFEKDFRLIMIRKSSLLIYLIIGVVFTWSFSGSFSGAYITMLGTILALSTISYDDADNCMEFIFTLPCTRRQYVIEKYLFIYGFSFVAGLIGLVIIIAASFLKGVPINESMILEIAASEIPILIITGGLMMPLQLKFGAEKSRVVLLILFGIGCVIVFAASKMTNAKSLLIGISDTLNSVNPVSLVVISGIILIAFALVSALISVKIVENKEY